MKRQRRELMARAGKLIASKVPNSVPKMIRNRLFTNMLSSFRTIVSRNFGGNIGFAAMEQLRQPLASVIDKAVATKTGNRTTTGWSKDKQSAYINGFVKGFKEEVADAKRTFEEYKKGSISGFRTARTGENTLQNAVSLNEAAFSDNLDSKVASKVMSVGKGIVSKINNISSDMVQHGMSLGDRTFYEATRAQAQQEIKDLISRNYNVDTDGMGVDEYIDAASRLIALESVYQNDTAMSKAFQKMKDSMSEISQEIAGVDIITQANFPFVRTPSNVLEKAVQYSPLGLLGNAGKTIKEVKTDSFNQRRFVDETSRNVMGTALLFGAVELFSRGITSGAYDEDKDVRNAQKEAGMQEYALKLGDKYVDIGYIPVLGSTVESGAAFGDAYNDARENGKGVGSALMSGVGSAMGQTVQSVFDQSMMSNLSDLLGSTYGDESFLKRVMTGAYNILGQLQPAWSKQLTNSLDTNERYYGTYGTPEYYANSTLGGLLPLRKELPAKYNNAGEEVLQNQGRSTMQKIFENMVLPGKVTEYNETPLYKEAMRLYESTNSNKAFLPTAKKSDITTDSFVPTNADYMNYTKVRGEYGSSIAESLIDADFYATLDDVTKSDLISSAYSIANEVAKEEIIPGYVTKSKGAQVYKEAGAEGLANYLTINKIASSNGSSMTQKIPVLKKMDLTDAERGQYLRQNVSELSKGATQAYDKYGDTGVYNFYLYQTNANVDGNSSTSKSEWFDYLNRSTLTEQEQANYYYFANADNFSKKETAAYNDSGTLGAYRVRMLESMADANNNGSVAQKELEAYLKMCNFTTEQKEYYWKLFFPNAKSTPNF